MSNREVQGTVTNNVRPLPFTLTMEWDKSLFDNTGGFVVRFHSPACMGIVIYARSWYEGDFMDIQYQWVKVPKDAPNGYQEVVEHYLKYYFSMGRRSK